MKTKVLLDTVTILAGGNSVTPIIDLEAYAIEGFFSIHLIVSGSGTAKVEYMSSNFETSLDTDYVVQIATADVIVSDFTSSSGPGTNGKDVIAFNPEVSNRMKLKVTETGGVNSIVVTLIICLI